MKRQYSKPNMSVEMFEANEYIANCVKINCKKPQDIGVFYEAVNRIDGYQDDAIVFWPVKPDTPLSVCKHTNKTLVIKQDSIKNPANLYYDSNGTLPGGTVSKAYCYTGKADDSEVEEIHYFLNWTSTGTNAS